MSRRSEQRYAFTLVELLVSLFLLMLVMIGVNQVFTSTSATVGANTAISTLNRDAQAFRATTGKDIASIASDSAFINLRSEQRWGFRDIADVNSDADKDPQTADLLASGTEATLPTARYNFRSHRTDRISFFTRQLLQRQTGNENVFIAEQTTGEQFIWLGHLRLPNNNAYASLVDADFINPGEGTAVTNPNNLYAKNWTVGRMAIGLIAPTGATGSSPGTILDSKGVAQDFIFRSPTASATTLSPLAVGSNSTTTASATTYLLQESRYDLAGTSVLGYRTILSNALTANPTLDWWTTLMGGPTSRFRGMPYANRPLHAKAISQLAPVFATGASQFMIEYAGDFLNQDPTTGAVTDTYVRFDGATYVPGSTDGEVDFIIPTAGPLIGQRTIRWYGLPRSTSNHTTISGNLNGDVAPLRDAWRTSTHATSQASAVAPFERIAPATSGTGPSINVLNAAVQTNYATAMTGGNGYFYICGWGPSDVVRPKLIRIVLTLEDPNSRLPEGQTYEYVFAVP